jgi:hypothetical protein
MLIIVFVEPLKHMGAKMLVPQITTLLPHRINFFVEVRQWAIWNLMEEMIMLVAEACLLGVVEMLYFHLLTSIVDLHTRIPE